MRYTIGSILCTAYIIFCLLTQSAAGSWIIQRVNVPDIRDMAITYRNGHVIAESNTPEDINKFLDEIINRDDNLVNFWRAAPDGEVEDRRIKIGKD